MLLTDLIADLPGLLAVDGDTSVVVTGIASDSRQIGPSMLFVAYNGTGTDGHRYLASAVERGAVAVVGERAVPGLPVPYIQVQDGRLALAALAAAQYGHPSRSMALVGITGTDGKTTTANLLFSILRAAACPSGLISTVNAVIGDTIYDTGLHTTTPDAPDVQRYLAQMRAAGTQVAVLEATSHGLAQHRVSCCAFDMAVVTNITHEHLDFHGSYAAYRQAKALLFQALGTSPRKPGIPKTAVLNRDDGCYPFLAGIPAERTITYGVAGECPPDGTGWLALTAHNAHHTPTGLTLDVHIDPVGGPAGETLSLSTPLVGDYNVYNVLAATAAAIGLGLNRAHIQAGVAALGQIIGRMERIDGGQDFTAIVDFAHTPNALRRALQTGRNLAAPGGRVIVVFGCAGLRDREKRTLMGAVAGQLADYTVITAEDPRSEDLGNVMEETAAACRASGRTEAREFVLIPDRQRAIQRAVEMARPGDVVLVCGKGHEQSMCFGAREYPWQDQEALRWALSHLHGLAAPTPPFVLPTWDEGIGSRE